MIRFFLAADVAVTSKEHKSSQPVTQAQRLINKIWVAIWSCCPWVWNYECIKVQFGCQILQRIPPVPGCHTRSCPIAVSTVFAATSDIPQTSNSTRDITSPPGTFMGLLLHRTLDREAGAARVYCKCCTADFCCWITFASFCCGCQASEQTFAWIAITSSTRGSAVGNYDAFGWARCRPRDRLSWAPSWVILVLAVLMWCYVSVQ